MTNGKNRLKIRPDAHGATGITPGNALDQNKHQRINPPVLKPKKIFQLLTLIKNQATLAKTDTPKDDNKSGFGKGKTAFNPGAGPHVPSSDKEGAGKGSG